MATDGSRMNSVGMGRSNMESSMQHNEDKIAFDFVSLFGRYNQI